MQFLPFLKKMRIIIFKELLSELSHQSPRDSIEEEIYLFSDIMTSSYSRLHTATHVLSSQINILWKQIHEKIEMKNLLSNTVAIFLMRMYAFNIGKYKEIIKDTKVLKRK